MATVPVEVWIVLSLCFLFVILVIDLLYVPKILGFLLTHGLRRLVLSRETHFSISAFSIAPLRCRLLFKNVRYFSTNGSFRAIDGYVALRFWPKFFGSDEWSTARPQRLTQELVGLRCRVKHTSQWRDGVVKGVDAEKRTVTVQIERAPSPAPKSGDRKGRDDKSSRARSADSLPPRASTTPTEPLTSSSAPQPQPLSGANMRRLRRGVNEDGSLGTSPRYPPNPALSVQMETMRSPADTAEPVHLGMNPRRPSEMMNTTMNPGDAEARGRTAHLGVQGSSSDPSLAIVPPQGHEMPPMPRLDTRSAENTPPSAVPIDAPAEWTPQHHRRTSSANGPRIDRHSLGAAPNAVGTTTVIASLANILLPETQGGCLIHANGVTIGFHNNADKYRDYAAQKAEAERREAKRNRRAKNDTSRDRRGDDHQGTSKHRDRDRDREGRRGKDDDVRGRTGRPSRGRHSEDRGSTNSPRPRPSSGSAFRYAAADDDEEEVSSPFAPSGDFSDDGGNFSDPSDNGRPSRRNFRGNRGFIGAVDAGELDGSDRDRDQGARSSSRGDRSQGDRGRWNRRGRPSHDHDASGSDRSGNTRRPAVGSAKPTRERQASNASFSNWWNPFRRSSSPEHEEEDEEEGPASDSRGGTPTTPGNGSNTIAGSAAVVTGASRASLLVERVMALFGVVNVEFFSGEVHFGSPGADHKYFMRLGFERAFGSYTLTDDGVRQQDLFRHVCDFSFTKLRMQFLPLTQAVWTPEDLEKKEGAERRERAQRIIGKRKNDSGLTGFGRSVARGAALVMKGDKAEELISLFETDDDSGGSAHRRGHRRTKSGGSSSGGGRSAASTPPPPKPKGGHESDDEDADLWERLLGFEVTRDHNTGEPLLETPEKAQRYADIEMLKKFGNMLDSKQKATGRLLLYRDEPGLQTGEALDPSTLPIFGMEVGIEAREVKFGPWANYASIQLMRLFFPQTYMPMPELRPKLGEPRPLGGFECSVELIGETSIVLPFKRRVNPPPAPGIVTPSGAHGELAIAARDGIRILYKQPYVLPAGSDRVFSQLYVTTGAGVQGTKRKREERRRGRTQSEPSPPQVRVTTSLHKGSTLMTAQAMDVHLDFDNGRMYHDTQQRSTTIAVKGAETWFYMDHRLLIHDLITDWNYVPQMYHGKSVAEYHTAWFLRDMFVPRLSRIELFFEPPGDPAHPQTAPGFKVYLNTNQHNVMYTDDATSQQGNTFLTLESRRAYVNVWMPNDQHKLSCENESRVLFDVTLDDAASALLLPAQHEARGLGAEPRALVGGAITVSGHYTTVEGDLVWDPQDASPKAERRRSVDPSRDRVPAGATPNRDEELYRSYGSGGGGYPRGSGHGDMIQQDSDAAAVQTSDRPRSVSVVSGPTPTAQRSSSQRRQGYPRGNKPCVSSRSDMLTIDVDIDKVGGALGGHHLRAAYNVFLNYFAAQASTVTPHEVFWLSFFAGGAAVGRNLKKTFRNSCEGQGNQIPQNPFEIALALNITNINGVLSSGVPTPDVPTDGRPPLGPSTHAHGMDDDTAEPVVAIPLVCSGLSLAIRYTPRLFDFSLHLNPIAMKFLAPGASTIHSGETEAAAHDADHFVTLDGLDVTRTALYGPMPDSTLFASTVRLDVGAVTGDVTVPQLASLAHFGQCAKEQFTANDPVLLQELDSAQSDLLDEQEHLNAARRQSGRRDHSGLNAVGSSGHYSTLARDRFGDLFTASNDATASFAQLMDESDHLKTLESSLGVFAKHVSTGPLSIAVRDLRTSMSADDSSAAPPATAHVSLPYGIHIAGTTLNDLQACARHSAAIEALTVRIFLHKSPDMLAADVAGNYLEAATVAISTRLRHTSADAGTDDSGGVAGHFQRQRRFVEEKDHWRMLHVDFDEIARARARQTQADEERVHRQQQQQHQHHQSGQSGPGDEERTLSTGVSGDYAFPARASRGHEGRGQQHPHDRDPRLHSPQSAPLAPPWGIPPPTPSSPARAPAQVDGSRQPDPWGRRPHREDQDNGSFSSGGGRRRPQSAHVGRTSDGRRSPPDQRHQRRDNHSSDMRRTSTDRPRGGREGTRDRDRRGHLDSEEDEVDDLGQTTRPGARQHHRDRSIDVDTADFDPNDETPRTATPGAVQDTAPTNGGTNTADATFKSCLSTAKEGGSDGSFGSDSDNSVRQWSGDERRSGRPQQDRHRDRDRRAGEETGRGRPRREEVDVRRPEPRSKTHSPGMGLRARRRFEAADIPFTGSSSSSAASQQRGTREPRRDSRDDQGRRGDLPRQSPRELTGALETPRGATSPQLASFQPIPGVADPAAPLIHEDVRRASSTSTGVVTAPSGAFQQTPLTPSEMKGNAVAAAAASGTTRSPGRLRTQSSEGDSINDGDGQHGSEGQGAAVRTHDFFRLLRPFDGRRWRVMTAAGRAAAGGAATRAGTRAAEDGATLLQGLPSDTVLWPGHCGTAGTSFASCTHGLTATKAFAMSGQDVLSAGDPAFTPLLHSHLPLPRVAFLATQDDSTIDRALTIVQPPSPADRTAYAHKTVNHSDRATQQCRSRHLHVEVVDPVTALATPMALQCTLRMWRSFDRTRAQYATAQPTVPVVIPDLTSSRKSKASIAAARGVQATSRKERQKRARARWMSLHQAVSLSVPSVHFRILNQVTPTFAVGNPLAPGHSMGSTTSNISAALQRPGTYLMHIILTDLHVAHSTTTAASRLHSATAAALKSRLPRRSTGSVKLGRVTTVVQVVWEPTLRRTMPAAVGVPGIALDPSYAPLFAAHLSDGAVKYRAEGRGPAHVAGGKIDVGDVGVHLSSDCIAFAVALVKSVKAAVTPSRKNVEPPSPKLPATARREKEKGAFAAHDAEQQGHDDLHSDDDFNEALPGFGGVDGGGPRLRRERRRSDVPSTTRDDDAASHISEAQSIAKFLQARDLSKAECSATVRSVLVRLIGVDRGPTGTQPATCDGSKISVLKIGPASLGGEYISPAAKAVATGTPGTAKVLLNVTEARAELYPCVLRFADGLQTNDVDAASSTSPASSRSLATSLTPHQSISRIDSGVGGQLGDTTAGMIGGVQGYRREDGPPVSTSSRGGAGPRGNERLPPRTAARPASYISGAVGGGGGGGIGGGYAHTASGTGYETQRQGPMTLADRLPQYFSFEAVVAPVGVEFRHSQYNYTQVKAARIATVVSRMPPTPNPQHEAKKPQGATTAASRDGPPTSAADGSGDAAVLRFQMPDRIARRLRKTLEKGRVRVARRMFTKAPSLEPNQELTHHVAVFVEDAGVSYVASLQLLKDFVEDEGLLPDDIVGLRRTYDGQVLPTAPTPLSVFDQSILGGRNGPFGGDGDLAEAQSGTFTGGVEAGGALRGPRRSSSPVRQSVSNGGRLGPGSHAHLGRNSTDNSLRRGSNMSSSSATAGGASGGDQADRGVVVLGATTGRVSLSGQLANSVSDPTIPVRSSLVCVEDVAINLPFRPQATEVILPQGRDWFRSWYTSIETTLHTRRAVKEAKEAAARRLEEQRAWRETLNMPTPTAPLTSSRPRVRVPKERPAVARDLDLPPPEGTPTTAPPRLSSVPLDDDDDDLVAPSPFEREEPLDSAEQRFMESPARAASVDAISAMSSADINPDGGVVDAVSPLTPLGGTTMKGINNVSVDLSRLEVIVGLPRGAKLTAHMPRQTLFVQHNPGERRLAVQGHIHASVLSSGDSELPLPQVFVNASRDAENAEATVLVDTFEAVITASLLSHSVLTYEKIFKEVIPMLSSAVGNDESATFSDVDSYTSTQGSASQTRPLDRLAGVKNLKVSAVSPGAKISLVSSVSELTVAIGSAHVDGEAADDLPFTWAAAVTGVEVGLYDAEDYAQRRGGSAHGSGSGGRDGAGPAVGSGNNNTAKRGSGGSGTGGASKRKRSRIHAGYVWGLLSLNLRLSKTLQAAPTNTSDQYDPHDVVAGRGQAQTGSPRTHSLGPAKSGGGPTRAPSPTLLTTDEASSAIQGDSMRPVLITVCIDDPAVIIRAGCAENAKMLQSDVKGSLVLARSEMEEDKKDVVRFLSRSRKYRALLARVELLHHAVTTGDLFDAAPQPSPLHFVPDLRPTSPLPNDDGFQRVPATSTVGRVGGAFPVRPSASTLGSQPRTASSPGSTGGIGARQDSQLSLSPAAKQPLRPTVFSVVVTRFTAVVPVGDKAYASLRRGGTGHMRCDRRGRHEHTAACLDRRRFVPLCAIKASLDVLRLSVLAEAGANTTPVLNAREASPPPLAASIRGLGSIRGSPPRGGPADDAHHRRSSVSGIGRAFPTKTFGDDRQRHDPTAAEEGKGRKQRSAAAATAPPSPSSKRPDPDDLPDSAGLKYSLTASASRLCVFVSEGTKLEAALQGTAGDSHQATAPTRARGAKAAPLPPFAGGANEKDRQPTLADLLPRRTMIGGLGVLARYQPQEYQRSFNRVGLEDINCQAHVAMGRDAPEAAVVINASKPEAQVSSWLPVLARDVLDDFDTMGPLPKDRRKHKHVLGRPSRGHKPRRREIPLMDDDDDPGRGPDPSDVNAFRNSASGSGTRDAADAAREREESLGRLSLDLTLRVDAGHIALFSSRQASGPAQGKKVTFVRRLRAEEQKPAAPAATGTGDVGHAQIAVVPSPACVVLTTQRPAPKDGSDRTVKVLIEFENNGIELPAHAVTLFHEAEYWRKKSDKDRADRVAGILSLLKAQEEYQHSTRQLPPLHCTYIDALVPIPRAFAAKALEAAAPEKAARTGDSAHDAATGAGLASRLDASRPPPIGVGSLSPAPDSSEFGFFHRRMESTGSHTSAGSHARPPPRPGSLAVHVTVYPCRLAVTAHPVSSTALAVTIGEGGQLDVVVQVHKPGTVMERRDDASPRAGGKARAAKAVSDAAPESLMVFVRAERLRVDCHTRLEMRCFDLEVPVAHALASRRGAHWRISSSLPTSDRGDGCVLTLRLTQAQQFLLLYELWRAKVHEARMAVAKSDFATKAHRNVTQRVARAKVVAKEYAARTSSFEVDIQAALLTANVDLGVNYKQEIVIRDLTASTELKQTALTRTTRASHLATPASTVVGGVDDLLARAVSVTLSCRTLAAKSDGLITGHAACDDGIFIRVSGNRPLNVQQLVQSVIAGESMEGGQPELLVDTDVALWVPAFKAAYKERGVRDIVSLDLRGVSLRVSDCNAPGTEDFKNRTPSPMSRDMTHDSNVGGGGGMASRHPSDASTVVLPPGSSLDEQSIRQGAGVGPLPDPEQRAPEVTVLLDVSLDHYEVFATPELAVAAVTVAVSVKEAWADEHAAALAKLPKSAFAPPAAAVPGGAPELNAAALQSSLARRSGRREDPTPMSATSRGSDASNPGAPRHVDPGIGFPDHPAPTPLLGAALATPRNGHGPFSACRPSDLVVGQLTVSLKEGSVILAASATAAPHAGGAGNDAHGVVVHLPLVSVDFAQCVDEVPGSRGAESASKREGVAAYLDDAAAAMADRTQRFVVRRALEVVIDDWVVSQVGGRSPLLQGKGRNQASLVTQRALPLPHPARSLAFDTYYGATPSSGPSPSKSASVDVTPGRERGHHRMPSDHTTPSGQLASSASPLDFTAGSVPPEGAGGGRWGTGVFSSLKKRFWSQDQTQGDATAASSQQAAPERGQLLRHARTMSAFSSAPDTASLASPMSDDDGMPDEENPYVVGYVFEFYQAAPWQAMQHLKDIDTLRHTVTAFMAARRDVVAALKNSRDPHSHRTTNPGDPFAAPPAAMVAAYVQAHDTNARPGHRRASSGGGHTRGHSRTLSGTARGAADLSVGLTAKDDLRAMWEDHVKRRRYVAMRPSVFAPEIRVVGDVAFSIGTMLQWVGVTSGSLVPPLLCRHVADPLATSLLGSVSTVIHRRLAGDPATVTDQASTAAATPSGQSTPAVSTPPMMPMSEQGKSL